MSTPLTWPARIGLGLTCLLPALVVWGMYAGWW